MDRSKENPLVSIILPIRNEEVYIERTLNSILRQDYPFEQIEIIIVDGMSTDKTREIISKFHHQKNNLIIIDNPKLIVPTALNLALRIVKGEIIIRVDGHCEIAQDYVRKCVIHLNQNLVDVVGGPIETIGETYVARAIAIGMSSKFGVGGSAFRTKDNREIEVDTVAFPAFKRRSIEKTGLFDDELVRNQDDEYSFRLRKWGGKIMLIPEIRARYYSRSSLMSVGHQYFQYGYWKVRVLQKHPRQMSLRHFIPPVFVSTIILALVALPVFPEFSVYYLLIPFSYLFANLTASLLIASRRGWQFLPIIPLIYSILHITYGAGFLFGLIKFANRWGDKTGCVPRYSSTEP